MTRSLRFASSTPTTSAGRRPRRRRGTTVPRRVARAVRPGARSTTRPEQRRAAPASGTPGAYAPRPSRRTRRTPSFYYVGQNRCCPTGPKRVRSTEHPTRRSKDCRPWISPSASRSLEAVGLLKAVDGANPRRAAVTRGSGSWRSSRRRASCRRSWCVGASSIASSRARRRSRDLDGGVAGRHEQIGSVRPVRSALPVRPGRGEVRSGPGGALPLGHSHSLTSRYLASLSATAPDVRLEA